MAKLKSKNKQAFAEFYDLYIDKIYRFVFFKVGDKLEAEDLTSSIFLKTWNSIQQNDISDYKTMPSLVYKIARNSIIDHYRKSNREEYLSGDSEDEVDIADEKLDLKISSETASDYEMVKEKLNHLKDEYKEIIILKYIDELSINEIAEILDKNKGNVRVLMYRALNALKELVNENNKK